MDVCQDVHVWFGDGREFWRLLDRPFRMLTSQYNVDVWYDETDEMMDYWVDWEGMVREEDRKGEGRKEGSFGDSLISFYIWILTSQYNVDVWYDETDEMMDYWIDWEGMVREEDRKGERRKEGREFWRLLDRPLIFEFWPISMMRQMKWWTTGSTGKEWWEKKRGREKEGRKEEREISM